MKRYIIYTTLLALFICCKNEKTELDNLLNELENLSIDSESFNKFFTYTDEIIQTKNSKELTKIAIELYHRIGYPSSKQARERLYIAVSFLDKALELNPRNEIAMENKVHFLGVLGDYTEAINTINWWIGDNEPSYKDYMQMAFLFEASSLHDSSEIYFRYAEKKHLNTRFRKRDIEGRSHLAIIRAFLYGGDVGLCEIQELVNETNHPTAHFIKDFYLQDFKRDEFIYRFVLDKPIMGDTIIINFGE